MRGSTPEARARVRESLGLAEQMTIAIELAAVHGCIIFAGEVEESAERCDREGPCLSTVTRIFPGSRNTLLPRSPVLVDFGGHHATSQVKIAARAEIRPFTEGRSGAFRC